MESWRKTDYVVGGCIDSEVSCFVLFFSYSLTMQEIWFWVWRIGLATGTACQTPAKSFSLWILKLTLECIQEKIEISKIATCKTDMPGHKSDYKVSVLCTWQEPLMQNEKGQSCDIKHHRSESPEISTRFLLMSSKSEFWSTQHPQTVLETPHFQLGYVKDWLQGQITMFWWILTLFAWSSDWMTACNLVQIEENKLF